MQAATFTGTLLGRVFQTDSGELYNLLAIDDRDGSELRKVFPTFSLEVVKALQLMESKRVRAARITFFNYRLQVWAESRYDADPTPPVRIIPLNIDVGPVGPVTFERECSPS